jgi:four helix bundle suffix protein
MPEPLIPKHGGYRNLKSFKLARLVYDLTVHFANEHIPRSSRTHDQMVQAARSGTQNIAEGSQASGTSKKMELKLTNVARASLEELRLDYEDYLRQKSLSEYPRNSAPMQRFQKRRCDTLECVFSWVETERTEYGLQRTDEALANAALSLLYVACYLLDRQIGALSESFIEEGGFTERLYRVRTERRNQKKDE